MTATIDRPKLTAKQQKIFEYILLHREQRGYCVTVRDICHKFAFASPHGAQCHLNALRRKGYITWEPGMTRTIRVAEADHASEQ